MDNEISIQELTKSDIQEDLLFKIILVGDCAVGKSNILSRYIHNEFNKESKTTIGVELSSKSYQVDNKIIKINIWDTVGQERFTSLTSAYYKGAQGALIVYDITRQNTFDNISKWYKELKTKIASNINVILLGNKSDLSLLRKVTYEKAKEKANLLNVKLYETSALDANNINEAFRQLICDIYRGNNKEDIIKGSKIENKDKENNNIRCNC